MTVRFKFLTGDVDWLTYGGTWISQKFNNGDFDYWLVRRIFNWEEVDSTYKESKYNVQLSVVAPEEFENKDGAMSCLSEEKGWEELNDEQKVEIIYEYTGGVVINEWNGNNYKKLFALCTKEAELVSFLFGFYMDRPVNRIGSTGWDIVKGDTFAGLKRV